MIERGLREIKKEATAQALAQSAFELALERGVDGFIIDEVVRRAGYSRRTFTNYFSCKEEAIASVLFDGVADARDFIRDQPESTSLVDTLHSLIRSQLSSKKLGQLRDVASLCCEYPTLQPHVLEAVMLSRQTTVAAFMEFAKGRYSEQYVITLVGVAYGALALLFDGSLDLLIPGQTETGRSGAVTFEEFLDTTFAYLRTGF